jgi:hypothetical protein
LELDAKIGSYHGWQVGFHSSGCKIPASVMPKLYAQKSFRVRNLMQKNSRSRLDRQNPLYSTRT